MNVREYISTGILEEYLLGLLNADQQKSVEAAMAEYPAIREAYSQLEKDLELYAQAKASTLPEGLAAASLARIDAQAKPRSPIQRRLQINTLIWGILTLLLTGTLAYSVFRNDQLKRDRVEQQVLIDSISVACNDQNEEFEQVKQQLEILRNGSYLPIALRGTELMPDALATVYYNSDSGANYIDVLNLPDLPAGKAYQLWTLVPDQDPIDMGVLKLQEIFKLQDFPYAEGAIAFAVTIEPEGGSAVPTLDQMVLYGAFG